MLVSVTNEGSGSNPEAEYNEYNKKSTTSDGWYSDDCDEVFVLDFDPGNFLDDPCKTHFSDNRLFEGEEEFADTSMLTAPIGNLYDGSLFDAVKEQNFRDPSPIPGFSIEQSLLGPQFNLKQEIREARGESEEKKVSHCKKSETRHEKQKKSSDSKRSRKKAKTDQNQGNERKALYGDSWHTIEYEEGEGSNGEYPRKTYASGNLKQKRTSKFRGVSCCGKDRKWQARIRESNRVRYLGRFQTEVEAAVVYDEASRQCKGESAPTNFVRMDTATMKRVQDAYEKLGHIPVNLHHLIANPRKTKPKKKSDKRQYIKRKDLEKIKPSTPKGCPKRSLSNAEMSPTSAKLNPAKRFQSGDDGIPARPSFGHVPVKFECGTNI